MWLVVLLYKTHISAVIVCCHQIEALKCPIFLTFCVTIFVLKSISFQLGLLLRFMCSYFCLYFLSVLQSISVSLNEIMSISVSISVNEYNTDSNQLRLLKC